MYIRTYNYSSAILSTSSPLNDRCTHSDLKAIWPEALSWQRVKLVNSFVCNTRKVCMIILLCSLDKMMANMYSCVLLLSAGRDGMYVPTYRVDMYVPYVCTHIFTYIRTCMYMYAFT